MSTEMSPLMRSALDDVTRKLGRQVPRRVLRGDGRRVVEDSYERLGDAPTVGPNFTPIFVERFARERLQAVAQAEGLVPKALPELLFVCVHNAGRSQMAAALAHELSNGSVAVRSAGSDPTETDPSGRRRGDGRARHRCPDGVPEAADRRGRPRRRRGGHARVRRCLSDVSGQALRGLGGRRSGRAAARGRAPDPLRHPPSRDASCSNRSSIAVRRAPSDRADQEPTVEPSSCDHRHPRQPARACRRARRRSTRSGSTRSTAAAISSATARTPTRSAR